jgi:acyl-coenzyme A synthetase/AMP-(fatty) acid ligase
MAIKLQVYGNGSSPDKPIHSITQLVDIRADEIGTQPAIHTLIPELGDQLQTLTYAQMRKAIERLAWHYTMPQNGGLRLELGQDGEPPPVTTIGLFFHSSLNLTFTEFAMHRLGLASLLVSPNNSATAVAGLLKATGAHTLIVGARLADTANDAVNLLKGEGYKLEVLPEKVFPLWGDNGVDAVNLNPYPSLLAPEQETERPCIILHSSGSVCFALDIDALPDQDLGFLGRLALLSHSSILTVRSWRTAQ